MSSRNSRFSLVTLVLSIIGFGTPAVFSADTLQFSSEMKIKSQKMWVIAGLLVLFSLESLLPIAHASQTCGDNVTCCDGNNCSSAGVCTGHFVGNSCGNKGETCNVVTSCRTSSQATISLCCGCSKISNELSSSGSPSRLSSLSKKWVLTESESPISAEDACTYITLTSLTATEIDSSIIIAWENDIEIDNIGFNVWRSEDEERGYIKITNSLISAQGSNYQYIFTDDTAEKGKTYYYKLEDIDLNGTSTFHGPVSTKRSYKGLLPAIRFLLRN